VLEAYGERYDALLGRRTYDMWSTFWPNVSAGDPFADRLSDGPDLVSAAAPR
jgi:hypothetical protein